MINNLFKVKIVVPVYNTEKYISRCIDSILAQTYKNFSLIIIDDGSTDASGNICEEYRKIDSRVIVIHQENRGLSNARNRGIEYPIENDFITFVDSDDIIHPKYLEYMLRAIESTGCKVVVVKHSRFSDDLLKEDYEYHVIETCSPQDCYCMKKISVTPAWGKLFDSSIIGKLRFPEGKIHEDYYFTWKLVFSVNKLVVVNNTLYYYFQNENGIMHSKWNPRRMDIFEGLQEQIEFFEKNGLSLAWGRAVFKRQKIIDKYINMVDDSPYRDEYIGVLREMRDEKNV